MKEQTSNDAKRALVCYAWCRSLTAVGMALVALALSLTLHKRDGVRELKSTGSVNGHSSRGEGAQNESRGQHLE